MSILLIGASVTAQKQTGYAVALKQLMAGVGLDLSILGYGAGHFDDAGYFSIPKITQLRPSALLLDWHTTGLDKFNSAKLELFLSVMNDNSIRVVFLILPRVGKNTDGDRACELQIKKLADEGVCEFVDLRKGIDYAKTLYDGYHTNELGAVVYASLIFESVKSLGLDSNKATTDACVSHAAPGIPEQIFSASPSADLNRIFLSAEVTSTKVQDLCICYSAGPYSPVLSINIYGAAHFEGEISLFDAWCDVERTAYLSVWPKGLVCPAAGMIFVEATVLTKDPDFSVCKKRLNSQVSARRFPVQGVYASGLSSRFLISN